MTDSEVEFEQEQEPEHRKKNMKYLILSIALLISAPAMAESSIGAGFVLGDPTGFSFKYNMSQRNSIDGAISWSDTVDIHIHGDYLWNRPKFFYLDHYPMDAFYGIGARLKDRNNDRFKKDDDGDMQFGVRAPVGLRFMFHDPEIEIFTELALILNMVPSTKADIDFGIGARYFF